MGSECTRCERDLRAGHAPDCPRSPSMRGPFRFVGWHAQFEFKVQDFWIGALWKRIGNCIDLWVCFVPCLPLHVSWWWTREPQEPPAWGE